MLQLCNNHKQGEQKGEEHFWNKPLGAWIKDCIIGSDALLPEATWRIQAYHGRALQFSELCDGFVFSLLFVLVEPDTLNLIIMREGENSISDTANSLKRLSILLQNIWKFYRKQLNKLIVMPLPDLLTIVRNPYPDDCEADVSNVLLLLLGCAVQGEQRGKFIERIKRMEEELQTALLNQIKKVAEEGDCILNLQAIELISQDDQKATILAHLESIMKERDRYANRLYEISSERESDENSTTTGSSSVSSEVIRTTKMSEIRFEDPISSPSTTERHTSVELASAKAELRKLRNVIEERDEMIAELKDEAEAREVDILKMHQERLELVKDARAAKDYRDELECLQHKLANYDKLEADNGKLKEKLSELDFFKSRVTQLKEENELMQESCSVLEDQLDQCQRKISNHIDMERKLADYQDQIKQYLVDITKDREKIEHLLVDNGRLERELNNEQQKNLALERKMKCINEDHHSSREDFGSLGSQIADDDKKRILELELENRKLRTKLESPNMFEESREIHAKLLRIEIELSKKKEECGVLSQQVQELQITLSQVTSQYQKACDLCNTLAMERDLAQQNLQEARKKFSDFQKDFQYELKNDLSKKVSELQETLKAKERVINCLREAKVQTDEDLRKTVEISTSDMEELKNKLQQAEQTACDLEKQKKLYENERNTQKAINEQLEERIEENRLQVINMENIQKKLEACERTVMESRSRVNELESENRQLNQQLELELKKMDRLREDLVAAKSRCSDLISRLRSICVSIQLNGGKCEIQMMQSIDDDGDNDDDQKIFEIIDDVIMKALTAARREADALRLQQHAQIAELNDLKEDIERLRRSESDLNESDDRLRQLTTENRNIKEQVFLLQERIREMQQENSSKCSEVTSLKRELEELQQNSANRSKLHTELAKLQVSVRNRQLQEELLRQDNVEMQKQLKIYEEEKLATKTDFESLQSMHNALLMDHDRLQTLHDMLSADYDRAKYDNTLLNIKLKNQKGTAEEVLNERRQFEELKLALAEERERHDHEIRLMRNDMIALRNNYEQIRKDNISLTRNTELSQDELRKLRFAEQNQRTISGHLTAQIDDLQRKLQAQNLEITELLQKIELLTHLNKTLDEENQTLDRQINHLLAQNQDLAQTLNDKEIYYNAQKDFQEKLSSLRNHKEQLGRKIMERYHILENKKIATKEEPTFVEGTAKALISKNPGPYKWSTNDCDSNDIFSAEKFVNGDSTGESTAYPTAESLTMTAAKRDSLISANGYCAIPDDQPCSSSDELTLISKNSELRENGSQASLDSKNNPMYCSRSFTKNVFRAEYSSIRRTVPLNERSIDVVSLNGSERGVDVPSPIHSLPPRPPSRSISIDRSSQNRPPPPTYQSKNCIIQPAVSNKPPPPPYKSRVMTPTKQITEFSPKATSTPKLEHSESEPCPEDEKRSAVCDRTERNEKTRSIYENVDHNDISLNSEIGTVWYEYGCV